MSRRFQFSLMALLGGATLFCAAVSILRLGLPDTNTANSGASALPAFMAALAMTFLATSVLIKDRRLLLAIAVFVLGGISLTGTKGGLASFSPHALEYTYRSEFTLFGGALPIYRSSPEIVEHPLVEMLKDEGFVAAVESDDSRRELIYHWNYAWRDGYGPLYNVFVRHRKEIIEWSKADRERARIYWEQGFKYLRSQNEVDVWIGREILDRAWDCGTIAELDQRIESIKKSIHLEVGSWNRQYEALTLK